MNGYSYDDLCRDIASFPTVFTAGRSSFGRRIFVIRIGGGGGMLVHGAIHAREHITTPVVLAMAKRYASAHVDGCLPPCDFVPMVNPDGVQLCLYGVQSAPIWWRRRLLRVNGSADFALWKANGCGVDCNVNFAADWGHGAGNVQYAAPAGYIGRCPACAPEVRTLVRLTQQERYLCTLSYHCKGEVIYYGFGQGAAAGHSERAAQRLAAYLGYEAHTSQGSCGGYKDWYALHYPDGVALTVEIGNDKLAHPFPYGELPRLVRQHQDVPQIMATYVARLRQGDAGR